MRVRLVISAFAAAAVLAFAAGCGGGDDGGDATAAATIFPAGSPVYIEAALRPEGEVADNVNSLAKKLAGVDDLGELIISELEESALADGQKIDFDKEISPWLGENVGMFLQEYDGEDFEGYGVAIEVSDEGEAEAFLDKVMEEEDDVAEEGSYEGVDFKVEEDGETSGFIGGFLVVAQTQENFEAMVDAEGGDNLSDDENFSDAIGATPDGGLVDIYVDIGALIEEANEIDAETEALLETAGIDAESATATASLIPGSDSIEVDFTSDVLGEGSDGDATALLEGMPGGAIAAGAFADVGETLGEAVDKIDEEGIEGEIPPNELKKALKEEGIDLDAIGNSIGDVAFYVEGNTPDDLTGAAVIEATDPQEANNTVSNLGLLLRQSGTPGVTAYKEGGATGFSIADEEIGEQPIVVAAKDDKIAISYGPAGAAAVLAASPGATLAESPEFDAAKSALGDTPILGFVNGPAVTELLGASVDSTDTFEVEEFEEVEPVLEKMAYAAIGSGTSGDRATAKLIVGFNE